MEMQLAILEATKLWKQYRLGECPVNALAGIDFAVERGDFVAIMGPSGSGKSTLLNLLGGLDRPSNGEITLDGQRLSILDDDRATLARRHNVGFIFQSYNLLPTLTAEENITLPLVIDGQNPARFSERVQVLVSFVGLADRRHHKPDQLSGGEQQRVAIARALVTQPAIVLADEPTGNLDYKAGTAIMELLRLSRDELKQTIIMVTHDPRSAAYAERVVFLRDGQIRNDITFDARHGMEQRRRVVIRTMETP
jgi:putative ABC transport system ATP-binding protein